VVVSNDDVSRRILEIEKGLLEDDPVFVSRVDHLRRREAVAAVAIFGLLMLGAVLLAVGLATASLLPWSLGLAALVASVLVDRCHAGAARFRARRSRNVRRL
jgi:hypothetical protein